GPGRACGAFAHWRDHCQRRLRYRRANPPRAGARDIAATVAAHGLAQSVVEPTGFQSRQPRNAGGPAAYRFACARRRSREHRARIAANHRGAAMTSDEVLDMARGLNSRGDAYALVTVVRAIAPTSAYLGAQAIVL